MTLLNVTLRPSVAVVSTDRTVYLETFGTSPPEQAVREVPDDPREHTALHGERLKLYRISTFGGVTACAGFVSMMNAWRHALEQHAPHDIADLPGCIPGVAGQVRRTMNEDMVTITAGYSARQQRVLAFQSRTCDGFDAQRLPDEHGNLPPLNGADRAYASIERNLHTSDPLDLVALHRAFAANQVRAQREGWYTSAPPFGEWLDVAVVTRAGVNVMQVGADDLANA